jgi:stage III sporulation protein AG
MTQVSEETQVKKQGFITRFAKLDFKKKLQYLAVLLIVIVILAIYFTSKKSPATEEPVSQAASVSTTGLSSIEEKLQKTLSQIDGAGRVQVMITYESSAELVPAISVDTQTSTTTDEGENGSSTTKSENTQSEVVTVNGSDGNSALVLKENSPPVKGVIVVAEGADDIGVKLSLLSAVETILNVSPDQVDVYKMQNE